MRNPSLGLIAAIALSTALPGCGKPVNPNDLPVSHWADPKSIGADAMGFADDCSVANAQAIVKSGLPFPHFGTKEEKASDGTTRQRITTVDYWLGGERFVFPAEIATSSSYPLHNPHRYKALAGSLPNFYPKGPAAPVKDGMGAMVEVTFTCMMNLNDPRFVNYKRPRSNEEGIIQTKAYYEKNVSSKEFPGVVTVNIRPDLKMTEVLIDRKEEANNQRFWEATYWPVGRELKDSFGYVSGIKCQTRHDPEQKRYGGRGWTCSSGIKVNPYVSAGITIYVSHLEQMPSIYDQVQQVINQARKAAE